MTFPSGGSVFEDELLAVKNNFEKWSPCERAIAVCTILKQFEHPTLRFIQSKIEATNAQNSDSEKMKFLEQKSNDKSYINELCNTYKSMTTTTTTTDVQCSNNNISNNNINNNKDSTYFESDRFIDSSTMNFNNNNNISYSNNNVNSISLMFNVADKFSTKEEILTEILNCILMLKIGNDDVIQEYLALIPYMVHDTQNRKIDHTIVLQTLSILVAHPALSSDDLRMVKDHTDRLKNIIQNQNQQWQTIAPPVFHQKPLTNTIFSSLSSVGSKTDNIFDSAQSDCGSLGRSSVGGSDYFISSVGLPCKQCHNNTSEDPFSYHSTTDEQNISFSKNGTEIHDFDLDQEQTTSQFHKNLAYNHLLENFQMKTRRSNSLTTGGMKQYDHQYLAAKFTSSTENLGPSQKQRSFSLSTENPRLLKTSSGSETRLDDLKPAYQAYQAFQSQHTGMKYVGHWLKKLRLHKYCQSFENMTFEDMMRINEEFLEQLGITQGARTKMVNSIQKLKERHARLTQAEQDLKSGNATIDSVTPVLTELADTPMKPINVYDKCNVAAQFLNVLNLVCTMLKSKSIGPLDEEMIDQLIEIFNVIQLGNTEPFQSQANQLKELRFEVDAIKRQFPPHNHYSRNGNGLTNGNSNKTRWSSSSKHNNVRMGGELKPHRKNSNPMSNFNCVSAQQVQKQQKSQSHGSKTKQNQQRMCRKSSDFLNLANFYQTPTSSQNKDSSKSSSYPNCSSSNSNTSNCSRLNGQQYANVNNQNANTQLHHSHHRHSVSNLSTMTPMVKTTVTITPAAPIPQHQKASNNCVGLHLSPQPNSHLSGSNSSNNSAITPIIPSSDYCLSCDNGHQFSMDWIPDSGRSHSTGGVSSSYPKQTPNKHLLGDTSPYRYLESLSLQMTEQAIN